MDNFTVITTIATSGSGSIAKVYAEVYAFHNALAMKYGGLTAKNYKVAVSSASLYSGPDRTTPRLGYAQFGDTLLGIGVQNGFLQTDRGWISLSQVTGL